MATEGLALRTLGREVPRVHHFERVVKHFCADHVRVEPAGGIVVVMRGEARGDGTRAVEINPPAAPRPEQELYDPFDVAVVPDGGRMTFGKDFCTEVIDRAVRLFEGDANRLGFPRLPDLFPKGAQGKNGRTELRVEYWYDGWSNKLIFESFRHDGGFVINRSVDFKFFNVTSAPTIPKSRCP